MKSENLPLFELFTRLQEAGLPLGLDEYRLLLKALQAGFGLPNEIALRRLCHTLWVKNKDDEEIFNGHFSDLFRHQSKTKDNTSESDTQEVFVEQQLLFIQSIIQQTKRAAFIGTLITSTLFILGATSIQLSQARLTKIAEPELLVDVESNPNSSVDLADSEALIPQNQLPTEETSAAEEITRSSERNSPVEGVSEKKVDEDELASVPSVPTDPLLAEDKKILSLSMLGFLIGVMLLSTTVTWFLIRKFVFQIKDLQEEKSNIADGLSAQAKTRQYMNYTIEDEIQFMDTASASGNVSDRSPSLTIARASNYHPLTKRQMQQVWRKLRRSVREGPKTEIDIAETVKQVGRQGLFVEPVMQSSRSNRTKLTILIDQDGSMVPFQSLGCRFMETALRAGHLSNTSIYYFHNCPVRYVYHDPLMRRPEALRLFLSQLLSPNSVVLIFSDAGAARNNLNPSRIQKTTSFLTALRQHVRHVVWLNPLPTNRWVNTTASEISKVVAMFGVDHQGFRSAVDLLRGRWNQSLTRVGTK